MHDWMISKKRYWGLALPIYDCPACGRVDVIGGRDELRERAVEGWPAFEGHTPHRPYVDAVRIACSGCGAAVSRVPDVGNVWLDAGIVPFSTLHYREDPAYWADWFPVDFVTESFPGQFRNWFYAMLAMSTVLRRQAPYRTIFGYATLLAEDGAPMHKSAGNAIEFDEAAERMGVDVMRWMYASARPDDNILFGWQAADEARRRLLILWNVYAFFVTYARLAGWSPETSKAGPAAARSALDRWVLSRVAGLAARVEERLRDYDTNGATRTDRGDDRRPLDLVPAPLPPALLAGRRHGRSRCGLRHAPCRPRRPGPGDGSDPAVHDRRDLRQPGRDRRSGGARQRPPHDLAGGRAGRPSGRRAGGGDGDGPTGRRARPDAPLGGRPQGPPAARPTVAGPARGRPARAGGPPRAARRRGQRQGGRADRRRVGAGRPAGQAAPAQDRSEVRRPDPGDHGRGPIG